MTTKTNLAAPLDTISFCLLTGINISRTEEGECQGSDRPQRVGEDRMTVGEDTTGGRGISWETEKTDCYRLERENYDTL